MKNLTGQVFGRLTIGAYAGSNNGALWNCTCTCGKQKVVPANALLRGTTKSCGCHRIDAIRDATVTHGEGGSVTTPEYRAYTAAMNRCNNPRNKNYADYGGRGIRFYEGWLHSYEAFLAHVSRRPSPLHSLDRVDNGGHYAPGNVRWATKSEQAANRRCCGRGSKFKKKLDGSIVRRDT